RRRAEAEHFPYTTLFRSLLLLKLRFATPLNNKTRQLPGFFSVDPEGLAASRNPIQQATAIGVGLPPKRSLSLRSIYFVVPPAFRSEEHTSELQSRENLVC